MATITAAKPLKEIFYFTNSGTSLEKQAITSESMKVSITDQGNKELIETLTTEGGPLQAGAMPALPGASDAQAKALVEAVGMESAAMPPKKKRKKGEDDTEKVEPKTPLESGPQPTM